jgi:tripartite-type tricarboxylate transporter receptor subunit TctC
MPAAQAQNYPVKPVRIVSAFAPGGTNDVIARIISQKLTDLLGQQFIVENKAGGGGVAGTEFAARAAPDGYTLSIATTTTHVIAAALRKLPYDPVKDFSPISLIGITPYVVIVHPSLPVRNMKELIALAKARPVQIEYGSGGVGTPGHLAGEMLNVMAKIETTHVPYKGGGPALIDTVAGQVPVYYAGVTTALSNVQAGRLRAVALTGTARHPNFPEVPNIGETVAGYETSGWYGLAGPAGLPKPVQEALL